MLLTFLGTGAGSPSRYRNVSSLALSQTDRDGSIWLFDCGEGTQHQFMRSDLKISKIRKIFITHLHGDHILGLPGLLGSRSLQHHASSITIYGPKGIAQFLKTIFSITESRITYPLDIQEIDAGEVFSDEDWTVEAGHLDHRIACFGYRLTQKEKSAGLDKLQLAKEGISLNYYSKLHHGDVIVLDDGRIICGRDYWSAVKKEKIIAIFGDTRLTYDALPLAHRADVLVHEATYDKTREDKADEYGHCTTQQAAEFARKAHVKRLIINHISSRYTSEAQSQRLLQECRDIFPKTELALDLETFLID